MVAGVDYDEFEEATRRPSLGDITDALAKDNVTQDSQQPSAFRRWRRRRTPPESNG